MRDPDCVAFLQWALPRLRLRWPGFRKVRRQVCKRLERRLRELGLAHISEYRAYLEAHADEWGRLDQLCSISISRFYRDRAVFQCLEREVLPRLAQIAGAAGEREMRCWSIGCAAGEEVYTLAIVWKLGVAPHFPSLGIRILATDVDPHAIERAREGRYGASSVKDLPREWLEAAFLQLPGGFSLNPEFREPVTFLQQDIREAAPAETFHCICSRYLAFTYFEEGLQREALDKIRDRLVPGGALVIGRRESLPGGVFGLDAWAPRLGVYRRSSASSPLPSPPAATHQGEGSTPDNRPR